MPEEVSSIQDVLRRRRRAAFVGRGGQVALFRENFGLPATDERKSFVLNVHGEGGVGKSTLLERWRLFAREQGAVEARIDEYVYGVPEAMASIAEQIGSDVMKEFQARYGAFAKGREQLERDPEAPHDLWTRMVRVGVKAGLHASKAVPGAGVVADLVDPDLAADAVDRVRVFLSQKLRDTRDVRLLLSPVEELSPVFVSGLVKAAARGPVVLFLDTYEQTGVFLDGWLRDLLAGRYGPLPLKVLLVVAGRQPLDPNQWSEYLGLVAPVPLSPFTEAETRQLLAAEGVTDERTVEVILTLSGGLPLLVDTLAKNRPSDPSAVGDPTGTAVERFLKWERDETRRGAALAAALPRRINEDLLAAATDMTDVSEVFGWLIQQPFVSLRTGRYQYHEVVRAPMLRWQRQRSPQRWRADHARLADRYRTWQEDLGPEADWSDATWRDYQVEETYHRLSASQIPLRSALQNGVAVAKAGPASARRWAEMIADVGRELENDEILACGTALLAGIDEDAEDCLTFLQTLLKLGHLDAVRAAQARVERARILYFADRDEQAIQECGMALDHDSECGEAYAVRGAAQIYLGRHDPALADFDRAVTLQPDNGWAIARRGETYQQIGRYEDALADFSRAIEIDSGDGWAITRRGWTYQQMGRYDEALTGFNRAIELDANHALAITMRGWTYQQMGRYDEALADFNRVVDSGHEWVIARRGAIYRLMGRYEDALADFNRAIEPDPSDDWVIAERGETYRLMGRYGEALADFNTAIEMSDGYAWAIGSRGQVYQAMGRYDEALVDFDRAIDLDPGYGWVITDRGWTYWLMGRYEDALAVFNRAVELDSNQVLALAGRGWAYQGMGRYDEALVDFDRAIDLDPSKDWVIASRGETYGLLGRYEDALADFNRAAELDPSKDWVIASRGECYRLMGRYEDALVEFSKAIEMDPDYAEYYDHRGRTYRGMGLPDDAEADFARAREIDPTQDWGGPDEPPIVGDAER